MPITLFLDNFFELGLITQSEFLTSSVKRDPGQIMLHRLESAASNLSTIFQHLNLPSHQISHANMPRLNITPRTLFNNKLVQDEVANYTAFYELFSEDLHLWNSIR